MDYKSYFNLITTRNVHRLHLTIQYRTVRDKSDTKKNSYQIFWNTAKIWDIEQRLNDINRSVPCYPNIESLKKQHATLHLSTLSTHCRILFGNVMHHHVAWTCLQVEVKFFHERDFFFCFLRQKRARERELALRWGQLPEPEIRSEGLRGSLYVAHVRHEQN